MKYDKKGRLNCEEEVKEMKGMGNNAPHGFMPGKTDGYAQMMQMGGHGQQGYGGMHGWAEDQEDLLHL